MKVKVIDKSIPETYNGGIGASVMPEEYRTIRPQEQPRRLDYVFRNGVFEEMELDIAEFMVKKYAAQGRTLEIVDENLLPLQIGDDLDEMNYVEVKDLLLEINKKLKAEGLETYPIAGKKEELAERIRGWRKSQPSDNSDPQDEEETDEDE